MGEAGAPPPRPPLAPGVTLDRAGVRVSGTVTLSAGTDDQGTARLVVATNFIFAYPLRERGRVTLVVVHRKQNLGFYHRGTVPPGDEGPQAVASTDVWWDIGTDLTAVTRGRRK